MSRFQVNLVIRNLGSICTRRHLTIALKYTEVHRKFEVQQDQQTRKQLPSRGRPSLTIPMRTGHASRSTRVGQEPEGGLRACAFIVVSMEGTGGMVSWSRIGYFEPFQQALGEGAVPGAWFLALEWLGQVGGAWSVRTR